MKKPPQFKPKKTSGKSVFKLPRLYEDNKWIKYSQKFLSLNPRCYSCGKKSQVTDHWRAHKNNLDLFWNAENVIPLCAKCHNFVTSSFDRFATPKLEEKLRWINEQRLLYAVTFKVKFVPIED